MRVFRELEVIFKNLVGFDDCFFNCWVDFGVLNQSQITDILMVGVDVTFQHIDQKLAIACMLILSNELKALVRHLGSAIIDQR